MEKLKMMFALTAVVALAGVMFAGAGFAAAQAPKFQTLKAAEAVWQNAGHICNENFGGAAASCDACYDKAGANAYADTHLYCTNNAYTDCGWNNDNNMNWNDNKEICYCDEGYAEGC